MAWLLWRMLRDPQLLKGHFDVAGFIEAIIIGVISNALVGILFSDMVAKSAPDIEIGRRISAYYYSQVAKYIPGRVAALLVQRSVLAGPRASAATIVSNLELMAITCGLCSAAALTMLIGMRTVTGAAVVAAAAVASGAWFMRLDWGPLVRRMQRMLPAYRSAAALPPTAVQTGNIRAVVLSASVLILPAASSYVLLVRGLNLDAALATPLTALLLLSWVGGMLAVVFPAGIGIRELIFFGLAGTLRQAPTAELMAGVALASRLAQVLTDAAGVLLFLVFRKFAKNGRGT